MLLSLDGLLLHVIIRGLRITTEETEIWENTSWQLKNFLRNLDHALIPSSYITKFQVHHHHRPDQPSSQTRPAIILSFSRFAIQIHYSSSLLMIIIQPLDFLWTISLSPSSNQSGYDEKHKKWFKSSFFRFTKAHKSFSFCLFQWSSFSSSFLFFIVSGNF